MAQDLFAGRYELLMEAPAGAAGRLFEARDTQTGSSVALKVFRRELPPGAPERKEIEAIFEAAKACSHPRLVRYYELVLDDGYLVREWVHGFALIDLLRRRRELPMDELIPLLDGLPEALDASVEAGIPVMGDFLSRIFVAWDRAVSLEEMNRLRGVSAHEWPAFTIKVNPLSLSHVLPVSPEETMSTIVGSSAQIGPILAPSVAFAEMAYQLLGAPRRVDRVRRYVPLGTLNEAGNTALRKVLESQANPKSSVAVWKDLTEAVGPLRAGRKVATPPPLPKVPVPPPPVVNEPKAPAPPAPSAAVPPPLPKARELQIPAAFLSTVQSGTILRLTASDNSYAPIQLIARPSFRIGRSLYHADFVTRLMPETAENEKLTKELGRVHAVAELLDGRMSLQDGNGGQPSVNGSSFNGQPLRHDQPTFFESRGVLALYCNYEVEIIPLLGSSDLGLTIANEANWPGPTGRKPTIQGGVIFNPLRGQVALRDTAWIFSRLDFAISPTGALAWLEAGSPQAEAAFVFYRKQFWLANFVAGPGVLYFNHTRIENDQIVPLYSGQPLQIGSRSYLVEIQ